MKRKNSFKWRAPQKQKHTKHLFSEERNTGTFPSMLTGEQGAKRPAPNSDSCIPNGTTRMNLIERSIWLALFALVLLAPTVNAGSPWFKASESPQSWSPDVRNLSWTVGQNYNYHNLTHQGYYICGWKTLSYTNIPDYNCLGAGYTTDGSTRSFYTDWAGINSSTGYKMFGFIYLQSGGQAVVAWNVTNIPDAPPAPVANFWCDNTYAYLGTSVICEQTSTNSPTTIWWGIFKHGTPSYISDDPAYYTKDLPPATPWEFTENADAGYYDIRMRANNTAGYDWENKTSYIEYAMPYKYNQTNQTVILPNTTFVPVAIATVATIAPITILNATSMRESITSALGNFTTPLLDYSDQGASGVSSLMTALFNVLNIPINMITGILGTLISALEEIVDQLSGVGNIILYTMSAMLNALPDLLKMLIVYHLLIGLAVLILRGDT
jgi:hypothetical protein